MRSIGGLGKARGISSGGSRRRKGNMPFYRMHNLGGFSSKCALTRPVRDPLAHNYLRISG